MINNQPVNLDQEIFKFKELLLTKYGVDVYIYEKLNSSGFMRPTVSQIENACVEVMHEMYPELKNHTNLSTQLRTKEVVMFRKIYFYLGYHAKYTCNFIGKKVNRHHASVIHGKNSVEDMIYIKDKEYAEALEKTTKIINRHVGITPKNLKGKFNTESVPSPL